MRREDELLSFFGLFLVVIVWTVSGFPGVTKLLVCMCSSWPCTDWLPNSATGARHKHTGAGPAQKLQLGCTQTDTGQDATAALFTSPGGLAATTTPMTCGPPALRPWHHHEALTVALLEGFLKVPCSARFSLAVFSCDNL